MRLLDFAIWLVHWADRFYLWAFTQAYPPRASDADFLVRSIMEDNVPSAATLARLTDE